MNSAFIFPVEFLLHLRLQLYYSFSWSGLYLCAKEWSVFSLLVQDVTMKVISFSQQGPQAICILSANGVISNVTLRQPDSSGGTLTYEVSHAWHTHSWIDTQKFLLHAWFHMYVCVDADKGFWVVLLNPIYLMPCFDCRDALSCCPCLGPLCQLKTVEHEVDQVGWACLLRAQTVVLSVEELPACWWQQVLFRYALACPLFKIWMPAY